MVLQLLKLIRKMEYEKETKEKRKWHEAVRNVKIN